LVLLRSIHPSLLEDFDGRAKPPLGVVFEEAASSTPDHYRSQDDVDIERSGSSP
jgi:hypothetical protein